MVLCNFALALSQYKQATYHQLDAMISRLFSLKQTNLVTRTHLRCPIFFLIFHSAKSREHNLFEFLVIKLQQNLGVYASAIILRWSTIWQNQIKIWQDGFSG